uniref:Cycloviolacin-O13 n=1 Tax=Viola odorata TaxID=97441 RepID=CYO13_VIOOD|nr:RecName: Full=Cycloviolacin-O13; AltName: Full=Cyclotide c3; Flags: Precursor [Viola odorata]AAU04394.1 cyclotide c3 precursor [Viola odorata]
MDAKKMFVALVLIATFALPSLATFEKDFITPETIQAILKKSAPLSNIMLEEDVINALLKSKTVISNPIIEEAFLKNSNGLNGIPCGESCVWIPCISAAIGCSCKSKVCYRNSLDN